MADKGFDISDNLPNLDGLILEEEIELISLELYNVSRLMTERGYTGESGNLRKSFNREASGERSFDSRSNKTNTGMGRTKQQHRGCRVYRRGGISDR